MDWSSSLFAILAEESLEAFEIFEANPNFGSRTVDGPILAQAWIARLESSNPPRNAQSSACRQLIRTLVSGSELIEKRLRQTNDFSVENGQSGEPGLFIGGRPSQCRISISHSGSWLGVAITNQPRIGIDVEASRPRGRYREMADYLGWDAKIADYDEFQARWTLWEACAKLNGSSIFSSSNLAYETLSKLPPVQQFFRSGSWACVRMGRSGAAHFALVVELASARQLRFRHYRPGSTDPVVTDTAVRSLRAKQDQVS